MSNIFFTSDLHFGHNNLINNLRHMTTEESDELIISNWNKIVTKRDVVYILGDLSMDKPDIVEDCLRQLKGTIKVILGNHDTFRVCSRLAQMGIKICSYMEYDKFLLSHIPVHPSNLVQYRGNIHGHIHIPQALDAEGLDLPKNKYFNVNCELHNYTPISYDVIYQHFSQYEGSSI